MPDRLGGQRLAGPVALLGLAIVPAVSRAQSLGPSTIVDAPASARALGSVVLVGLVGALLVSRYGGFVDRAVDATMDRPLIAILYGLFAYVLVLFFVLFALNLLTRLGIGGTPLGIVAIGIFGGGLISTCSVGYLVVGTLVYDLYSGRRPWYGLVLGALLSGVGWLFLAPLAGLAVWLLIPAVGIGGPTRTWVNREQTVAAKRRA